jgi:hypothetical protein
LLQRLRRQKESAPARGKAARQKEDVATADPIGKFMACRRQEGFTGYTVIPSPKFESIQRLSPQKLAD